jgi:hypothetical protein
METIKGYLRWDSSVMGIGGESSNCTLTQQDGTSFELAGSRGMLQPHNEQWVLVTGEFKQIGVENRRNAFVVHSLSRA